MKITPLEKRRHAAGREKNEGKTNHFSLIFSLPAACRLFSRGVIFTRERVSLALLSLRKIGGLLVVYDNFNLQGKSKKVRVIGSSRQIAGNKKMSKWDGARMQVSCTLHFKGSKRYTSIFFRKEFSNKVYAGMDTKFQLD